MERVLGLLIPANKLDLSFLYVDNSRQTAPLCFPSSTAQNWLNVKSTAVVGVCWETSLAITRLYFLDHSCHVPPMCQMLKADTHTHFYSALLFSLETVWPRILGQLRDAAERQSLEIGKQEGRGRHFPLTRDLGGIEGSDNITEGLTIRTVSSLGPAGSREQWVQRLQNLQSSSRIGTVHALVHREAYALLFLLQPF